MARRVSPFSIISYRKFWFARLSSNLASNAMVVVIGWQTYDIARRTMAPHEAALQLGLIGLVQFIPLALLTLVTGLVADRADRRWIACGTAFLELLCAATLAVLTWHGRTTLHSLFAIAALLGVARAFAQPALQALSPNLVPRALLPSAIAMGSIAWQVGAILGPPMGGYFYAVNPALPYIVSAVLFAVVVLMMTTIGPVPRAVIDRARHPFRQMADGLAYLGKNKLVLGAISLDLFAVLLGGATAMLPVFARDILHVGVSGLGHLRAAPAIGAAAVAITFTRWPLRRNVGVTLLCAVGLFGAATVVFGFSRWLPLSLACLAVLGAADMVSVYVRQSLIQLHTPDNMRGRVGAVSTLFISGSNELGEAESGFLAAAIGPVAAVVAGGIGTIIVAILWVRLFPQIPRARSFDVPVPIEDLPGQEKAT